jgi:hypothetical protein
MRYRKGFVAAIGVSVLLVVSDRAWGADNSDKKNGATGSASAPKLDGLWRGFVVEGKGENPNRGQTALELLIQDNRIAARRLDGQGGSLGEGFYKLTPVGRMTAMDAMEARRTGQPKLYLGICELTEDTIKWCVATPRVRRPMTFETRGQQFLLILKKQKQ